MFYTVLDFVNLGHAALPEQPLDAVRAYHRPFGKHVDIIPKSAANAPRGCQSKPSPNGSIVTRS